MEFNLAELDWQNLGMSALFVLTYIFFLKRMIQFDNQVMERVMRSIDFILKYAEEKKNDE